MIIFLMIIISIAIILFVSWIDGEWEQYEWIEERDTDDGYGHE